ALRSPRAHFGLGYYCSGTSFLMKASPMPQKIKKATFRNFKALGRVLKLRNAAFGAFFSAFKLCSAHRLI
ncbi:MAG: hypothetical protein ACI9S8_002472, partial [Chlamydiales bacterium]